ncbi:hypothetical protein JVU11DRAFT_9069 [Chiua virens]|nr:hypothetical protein JVU11DRAFT_9069 [Chiua virens]
MQSPCRPKSGKLTVLFDSGIRTGSDIIKALAMGAQGVLSPYCFPSSEPQFLIQLPFPVARLFLYGLTIVGQQGVEQILRQTICDFHVSMGLTGYGDINEIIGKRDEILMRLEYKL